MNATGAIFDEIDMLAREMDRAFNTEGFEVTEDVIRNLLDDWVKRRVIRFNNNLTLTDKDFEEARENKEFREMLAATVTDHMLEAIIDSSALIELNDDEKWIDVTYYMVACRDNF